MKEQPATILIVDDEVQACIAIQQFLRAEGFTALYANSGPEALAVAMRERPEAVLLDIRMPGMSGIETLQGLKEWDADCAVIMLTAVDEIETAVTTIRGGANDYLRKPVSLAELLHSIRSALEKRRLVLENREYQRSLEEKVARRTVEIELTRDVTLLALATLAEFRDPETGGHLQRIREYTKVLAQQLQRGEAYASLIDARFLATIYKASPMHDIGKVGIPDNILLKPGPLTPLEFERMKQHPLIGGRTLDKAEQVLLAATNHSFLAMAKEIAFCHHEKWDGSGYPGGIKGEQIPLSARIMCLADVYDALISKRVYKPAFPHQKACKIIIDFSGSHFDPEIVRAFQAIEPQFIEIKNAFADS